MRLMIDKRINGCEVPQDLKEEIWGDHTELLRCLQAGATHLRRQRPGSGPRNSTPYDAAGITAVRPQNISGLKVSCVMCRHISTDPLGQPTGTTPAQSGAAAWAAAILLSTQHQLHATCRVSRQQPCRVQCLPMYTSLTCCSQSTACDIKSPLPANFALARREKLRHISNTQGRSNSVSL